MNSASLSCPALYPIRPLDSNHKRVIVFDTETTGLLKYEKVNKHQQLADVSLQPYLTQLSYMIYSIEEERVVEIENDYCLLPNGISISPEASQVTGITDEKLRERGCEIVYVLNKFIYNYLSCDMAVAHNWDFDKNLLEIEIKRNWNAIEQTCGLHMSVVEKMFHPDYLCLHGVNSYCTMLESVHICDIKKVDKNGIPQKNAKWPRLEELYVCLFDDKPSGQLHNSLFDVAACLRCFIKLRLGKEMPRNRYYHLLHQCEDIENNKK